MKKNFIGTVLLAALLLTACEKDREQLIDEFTIKQTGAATAVTGGGDPSQITFVGLAESTAPTETTVVTAGENQVVIGGWVYDIDAEELYLSAQILTAGDADALSKMTDLKSLELNYFTDDNVENISKALSRIGDFSEITLKLSEAYVSDLSFLNELPNLKSLIVVFGGIKDYSTLENISTLETLAVRSSGISDYTQFGGLTNISVLDLGEGGADDLSPLSGLTNLKTLYLDHSTLGDLSPLSSLTGLEELYISYTNAADISPLGSMIWLKAVYLDETSVDDISPLGDLTELEKLSIDYDSADYIDTLNKLTGLKQLYITFTGTTDVLSLSGLTWLEEINMYYGSDVSEKDIEALRQALPSCEINTEYFYWLKIKGEDE